MRTLLLALWLSAMLLSACGSEAEGSSTSATFEQPTSTAGRATARYWQGMREALFAAHLQAARATTLGTKAAALRGAAFRITELDPTEVDRELIGFSDDMATLMRRTAEALARLPDSEDGVFDVLGKIVNGFSDYEELQRKGKELQELSSEVELEHMRLRRDLSLRYDSKFDYVTPPVYAGLTSFTWTTGYYCNVINASPHSTLDVAVTYSSPSGRRSHEPKRLNPMESVQLDPSEVGWTIGPDQNIQVSAGSYSYTYSTNDLLPD